MGPLRDNNCLRIARKPPENRLHGVGAPPMITRFDIAASTRSVRPRPQRYKASTAAAADSAITARSQTWRPPRLNEGVGILRLQD